jgi:uncharacterized protein DUF2630
MDDREILQSIEMLVQEEHTLTQQLQQGGLDSTGHQRMHKLAISLDQCWDLLRQRRALRAAHLNPDEASLRDADIVEHYKQ